MVWVRSASGIACVGYETDGAKPPSGTKAVY